MPSRIEDYALVGNCETAALVARNGSVDWLCLPRFDSGACFASLLGAPDNGCWELAPVRPIRTIRRRYRDCSLVPPELGSFVRFYGAKQLDASLLMIPLVGFLPPSDPRVRGTVEAIERQLLHDGFVQRYPTESNVDGLPAGEGAFLACTLWLADNLYLLGRHDDAREVFERLLALRNDVGLLSEEYDPQARRLIGNFP
jgi:GH15 family glucan-1,4-alpha-glucosidase